MQESIGLHATQIPKTSLKKYIAIGIVASYVVGFVFNALLNLLTSASIYYMVAPFAFVIIASFIAGDFFFKDQKRASSIEENARYTLHFMLWGVLLPFVLMAAALMVFSYFFYYISAQVFSPLLLLGDFISIAIAFGLILFVILMGFYYVLIRCSFSWYTRRQSQRE